jgi:hypothetical protein
MWIRKYNLYKHPRLAALQVVLCASIPIGIAGAVGNSFPKTSAMLAIVSGAVLLVYLFYRALTDAVEPEDENKDGSQAGRQSR